jgi:hypothetical protein
MAIYYGSFQKFSRHFSITTPKGEERATPVGDNDQEANYPSAGKPTRMEKGL